MRIFLHLKFQDPQDHLLGLNLTAADLFPDPWTAPLRMEFAMIEGVVK